MREELRESIEKDCKRRIDKMAERLRNDRDLIRGHTDRAKTEYLENLQNTIDEYEKGIAHLHYDYLKLDSEKQMVHRFAETQLMQMHSLHLQVAAHREQKDKAEERTKHLLRTAKANKEYLERLEAEFDRVNMHLQQAQDVHEDLRGIKINPISELNLLTAKAENSIV